MTKYWAVVWHRRHCKRHAGNAAFFIFHAFTREVHYATLSLTSCYLPEQRKHTVVIQFVSPMSWLIRTGRYIIERWLSVSFIVFSSIINYLSASLRGGHSNFSSFFASYLFRIKLMPLHWKQGTIFIQIISVIVGDKNKSYRVSHSARAR